MNIIMECLFFMQYDFKFLHACVWDDDTMAMIVIRMLMDDDGADDVGDYANDTDDNDADSKSNANHDNNDHVEENHYESTDDNNDDTY